MVTKKTSSGTFLKTHVILIGILLFFLVVAAPASAADKPTSTSVTSSTNPSVYGQSVTFTATVSTQGSGGTPTGSVQFKDNGVNLGTPVTLSSGVATYSTATLTSGTHIITAVYTPSGNFLPSTGTLSPDQTVNKRSTSVAISFNPATVVVEQGSDTTVTVTDTQAEGTKVAPTGTVTVTSGSGDTIAGLCELTPHSGYSTCAVRVTPNWASTHTITATFTATDVHSGSTNSADLTVNKRSTSTTVSLDPTTVEVGQSSTATVTVTDTQLEGTKRIITGTAAVTSSVPGDTITGPCYLSESGTPGVSTCSVTVTPNSASTHTITATFSENPYHLTSSGFAALTVNPACTAPSITTQPSSATRVVTESVTFSVTATGTGLSYQWRKGGSPIGGATSSSYTISSVVIGDAGSYDVVVTGTCGSATSDAATLTVNRRSTITYVDELDPMSVVPGQLSSVYVLVVDNQAGGTKSAPTGTVAVTSSDPGDIFSGTCTMPPSSGEMSGCVVTVTPVSVGSGSHTITATFSATSIHAGSIGTLVLTVNANHNVKFATTGLPGGVSITVDWTKTNPAGSVVSGSTTFNSPGPSSSEWTKPATEFSYTFPATISSGGSTYVLLGTSHLNPFTTGPDGGTTTVTASYTLPIHNVNFATTGLPSSVPVSVGWDGTDVDDNPISGPTAFASPGPSGVVSPKSGTSFSYSFPTSIEYGGNTYLYGSAFPSSPFTTGTPGGTTTVTATYTLAPVHQVKFATARLPGGVSVTVPWTRTNPAGTVVSGSTTFGSPGISANIDTKPATSFTFTFPSSLDNEGITYNFLSTSPSSPYTTGAGGSATIITGTYNAPPVANDQSVSTDEDTAKAVTLTASDADGDTLTYSIVAGPTNGALSGTAPALTYTPTANYHGSDSFTFKVNDGHVDSNTATISITVTAVNDAPVANARAVTTDEDTAKAITLTGSDVDGDTLTYSVVDGPAHGTLSGTGDTRTYTPNLNYNGGDTFTFTVNDGTVNSAPATVTITVTPVNDAPVATNDAYTTNEDTALTVAAPGVQSNDIDPDGDTLSAIVLTYPAHGILDPSAADGSFTYTPQLNYNGADSFSYYVSDGSISSIPATVSITVTPVNDAPVANPQGVNAVEDTPILITLTAYDVEGDPLTYSIVASPGHGTLTGSGAGRTYTPAANYNGPDTFTFTASDGTLGSNEATVLIIVNPVNDAPVADAQSVTTAEDTAKVITLTGSDVDGDTLSFTVSTNPAHGALSGTVPALTYTPAANYNGPDTFTFKANDGSLDSNEATVSITVTAVNDPPVANARTITIAEDTAIVFILTGSDVDGDTLTYSVVSGPAYGYLTGSAPVLTYSPYENHNGPDPFTFTVNDGTVDSSEATVTIIVTPVNDAPVATNDGYSTSEDTVLTVVAPGVLTNDNDVDGNPLTAVKVTDPGHGTVTLSADGSFTYTPAANYNGADSFTYKANDGTADSNIATVTLTVTPVNDAPVANAQSVTTAEDTAKAITLTGSDVDTGDVLTFTIGTPPGHGTLSGTGATQTYTPNLNYNGGDSFTFTANDGTVDSAPATVTITVTPVNDPPVATNDAYTTNEDTALTIALPGVLTNDNDVDGDVLTAAKVSDPGHGIVTLYPTGSFTYTPAANYNGADSFTYMANDDNEFSNVATVSITVTPVNDAPVANAQAVSTAEDTPKAITLTGSDVDTGDILTFTVVTGPANGALSGTIPALTYTPNLNYNGADSFTFKVNDGTVDSAPATVTLTVTAVNDVPVANGQTVTTNEDTALPITLTGSDVDDNPLTYSIVASPGQGTLSGTIPALTYTPAANYNGADSFTFKVNDGTVDSNTATVSITVTAVNDAPVADAQSVTTAEDTAKAITLTGSDVDGNPLTFAVVGNPAHGALSGTAPALTYMPAADYNGGDTFTFTANDGTVNSAPATVTITVTPVNDPPVADAQAVTTAEDTAKTITLTGSDVDGNPLTFAIGTGPAHGTLSGTVPALTYTPTTGYSGSDSFTFKVNDGTSDSNVATVSITVTAAENHAPVADAQSVTTDQDTPKAITLTATDADGDGLTYSIVASPGHGALSGSAPTVTYTPTAGYSGSDSFTFKAYDGTVDSNVATVSITVTPAAPVVSSVTVTPSTQQYSDLVTFTATLSPGFVDSVPRATSVTFLVGTQEIGTVPLVPSGGSLVGTLANVPLIEPTPFGKKPTGQMAPGTHTVTAKFISASAGSNNGPNDDHNNGPNNGPNINSNINSNADRKPRPPVIPDLTTTLTITQEDARATYTGPLQVSTQSAKNGKATVALAATVQDITAVDSGSDAAAGDIRNAKVTFVNRDTDAVLCTGPVGLVSNADSKTGTATCTWKADIGNADSLTYNVGIVVGNYYLRDDAADDTVITISKPGTEFITGGGFLVMSRSAGQYPGTPGSKTNFGFYIRYPQKGKNPDGNVLITVRNDGHTYQIRSTSITSLAVMPSLSVTAGAKAIVTAKATIQDVTRRKSTSTIDKDATLQMTMTDKGEPGKADTLGITVLNTEGGLWYSSNWADVITVEQTLGGGNLVIH